MKEVKPTYLRPWSCVDDEELRLLRELRDVCMRAFWPLPADRGAARIRMLQCSVPDRLHEILDRLK